MPHSSPNSSPRVAIIGGGPAGLMAAETLAQAGLAVDLYDAMPSVGRKFLLAGVGGMNITHSEAKPAFISRYGQRQEEIARLLEDFDADALRQWIHDLGIETFVGTSGRVFPTDMKAAPLLRAWLKRLRELGVQIHTRHRWLGWNEQGALRLHNSEGEFTLQADATLLALGGGSWARLGSDGAWLPWLQAKGVQVAPLQASNCGFDVTAWSDFLRDKFAGAPLKNVSLRLGHNEPRIGEFVLTSTGIEGSLVYALSAGIRESINQQGSATVYLDLLPQTPQAKLEKALSKPRGSHSMAKHLHRQAGIDGVKAALLRELSSAETFTQPSLLAAAIKALPIPLQKPRPIDEAISTAGGVTFEALNDDLMLTQLPGTFCSGEMLDWEAPTGGYLLTACFASGKRAAHGIIKWLQKRTR
ncbi:TIGR03862 family flavoprotein [Pseudomonas sp. TTU2014-080ASC]|uniref:TIGR03862 family flavoprotein n=1 Tax=Pseudomonas sp. TTU2014-080ASC TaxID=1729724 RepID=UPI000718A39F|nr:TIGR03862 family flavoprotein [Pseudomonas sp. TTU2014-080ASC]KRW58468.1 NAD(FAD)-utilizing dehydrogenase [Pseudomonas sp. TTU2014-080ASC]